MIASKELITKDDLLLLQPPVTIDEVIVQLEKIISFCETNKNRAGYFAMLYYRVTCKVRDCIKNKDFDNGERMERLDVAFANHYLQAFYLWIDGKPTSLSWKIAFDSVSDNSCLVLQHLLLGMNAHINFDLGIATQYIMKGLDIEEIHNDYNTINGILGSMIASVEAGLSKINPLMKLLRLDIFKIDDMLVNFSIIIARDGAWTFAKELSGITGNAFETSVKARDQSISILGISIAKPKGLLLKIVVSIIRVFDKKNVSRTIQFLGN